MHSGQSHHEWGQCEGNENKILAFYLLCNKDSSNPRWCEKISSSIKTNCRGQVHKHNQGKDDTSWISWWVIICTNITGEENIHKLLRREGWLLQGPRGLGRYNMFGMEGDLWWHAVLWTVEWQMWAMLLHLRMSVGMVNKLEVKRSYYQQHIQRGGSTSTPCHHLLTSMFKIHFLSSVEHKKRCFGHLRCYEKLSNKCCLTVFNI